MSHDRYYHKKNYKGDLSAFGAAIAFTVVGIISIVFMYVPGDFIGISTWGYWLFIPAFFSFIGGFSSIYWDRRMRNSVYAATVNRQGNVNVNSLSQELGIKPNQMLRILVDLRVRRGIKYSYDTSTGELVFGEGIKYDQAAEFTAPMSKKQAAVVFPTAEASYCPYCGHKPPAGSQFCENCGSKLT